MDKTLADLIKISRITGKDPSLVQAGGGNTSVKTDDGRYMYIKASGTTLKNMSPRAGWRRLRLDKILEIIKDKRRPGEQEIANRLIAACNDNVKIGVKPSVETLLHSLLDKYVIHVHPLAVCAYMNAKNGRAEIDRLFKGMRAPPLWVPYAPPGFILARKSSRLIDAYQRHFGTRPAIMFLAKHGLFVTAKTANHVMRLLQKVINRCESKLPKAKRLKFSPPAGKDIRAAKFAIRKAMINVIGRCPNISYFLNKDIAYFMTRKDAAKLLAKGPLGAAELVYANGPPIWVETPCQEEIASKLKAILRKGQNLPTAFVVKGLGLFAAADKKNVIQLPRSQLRLW